MKLSRHMPLIILRTMIGIIFISHATVRTWAGTVSGFGGFLDQNGLPFGTALAWCLTGFEFLGGIAMISGLYVHIVSLMFTFHMLMGILLVHAKNGWFVVGYSEGGAEYSVLIIAACLASSLLDRQRRAESATAQTE